MAAAADSATVFLETTLGTRLVVSFPARATTVADLKRQVTAEHAAGFPRTGSIAVTSLQVELDGSWFQLTDSMTVRAAFEWVKGPWRLRAEAHELRSHPISRKDAKCGTGDAEPNAGHPVISVNYSRYMLPPALSQGGYGSLVSGDDVSDTDTSQMNQQNKPLKGVESASVQCRDGITIPQESSDLELTAGDSDSPLPNEDKPWECVEHDSDRLEDGITMPQESSEFDLAAGVSDAPPTNQQVKSHESAEHEHTSSQCKDRITMLEESYDLGIAADKGNSPVGGQQKDIIAEPRGKKRFREGDKTVAHELRSHQLARKDAKCGTGDAEPNAGHSVISENYSQYMLPPALSQGAGSLASGDGVSDADSPQMNQQNKPQEGVKNASVQCRDGITMPQESSDIELAAGDSDTPLPTQDKPWECVEHGSDQLKDGITMPQESSEFDLAAGDSDTPPMNLQDKSHEGAEHASGQSEDRITMLEESSDLGIGAEKGNSPVRGQQKDIITEPRGKKRFREGDKTMAHELHSHQVARKDANCGTSDAEQNARHPVISENHSQYMLPPAASQGGGSLASGAGVSDADSPQMNQKNKSQEGVENASVQCRDEITMPQQSSDIELATGDSDTPLPCQEDKTRACVEHGSDQLRDGITMPQESSEFDLAAGDSDAPQINLQDKSHGGSKHASGQSQDRITMLEEISDFGIAADKGNSPVGSQQKDIVTEPRGKKQFREGDKTNERIVANCGDNLSSLASSTLNAELSEKKRYVTEQAKLNSVPLLYNLEGREHGLGEKASGVQNPSISGMHNGESSSNGSDLPPCVESMERKKSSDKEVRIQRGDEDGPCMAGHAGKSICKRTDVPHCVETMKEYVKRPAFNSHYINRGQNEGSTSTVNREREPCFRRSHNRIVVRKIPISRAMKVYSFRI